MRKPKVRKQVQEETALRIVGRATLADVAAHVGVSANTVSRSLRAPHTVRLDLRQRIERIVDELNYVPNRLAGGLAGSHTSMVGVIVTSLFNSEFATILDTLQQELAAHGIQVMIGNSAYDPEEELRLVKAMLSWNPAALAIVGTDHHPRSVEVLLQAKIPIVEFWDASDKAIDTMIGMDHRQIGRDQCQHLIERGCSRLAFVGSVRDNDYRARKRLEGVRAHFTKVLRRDLSTEVVREAGSPLLGERLAVSLLKRVPKIDGIVCNGDTVAFGVLKAMRAMGRRVPDDVAVIGFGDNEADTCLTPTLTTIRPPRVEIGHLAARAILSRINGGIANHRCLEATLIARESTEKSTNHKRRDR